MRPTPLSKQEAAQLRHSLRQLRGTRSTLAAARVRYGRHWVLDTRILAQLQRLAREEAELCALIDIAQQQTTAKTRSAA